MTATVSFIYFNLFVLLRLHGALFSHLSWSLVCLSHSYHIQKDFSVFSKSIFNLTMKTKMNTAESYLNDAFVETSSLKRALAELLPDPVSNRLLLITVIHSAMLEFGFVPLDSISGLVSSTKSLRYTLPEIQTVDSADSETVLLKFENLRRKVNVQGSLSGSGSGSEYMLCLDKFKDVQALKLMLADSDSEDRAKYRDRGFKLLKMVKDAIAYPLLIDLCEKAGLALPPCFMRLPEELKLKILGYLSGVEIAKMACLCSELRDLAKRNELWKQKFEEKFGERREIDLKEDYKALFAERWREEQIRKEYWESSYSLFWRRLRGRYANIS